MYLHHSLLNIIDRFRLILLLIVYTTFCIEFDDMRDSDFPSETAAVFLVLDVLCVGWRCRLEV